MRQGQFNWGGVITHLFFIFFPLILGCLHLALKPKPLERGRVANIFFHYYLAIGAGLQGLMAGFLQIAIPDYVAMYVGWPFSPFLREVGMANLVFAILAIIGLFIKKEGWKAAAAIGYSLFLLFAAVGHIMNFIYEHNLSPGNMGPTLWSDILVPIALLLTLSLRKGTRQQDS